MFESHQKSKMQFLFTLILILHIASGAVGLITGFVNIIQRKGGRNHILIGNIFTVSMLIMGIASFALARIHPNDFLLIVGIFTVYMIGTGKRYLQNKTEKPKWLDWILTLGMSIGGGWFIFMGMKALFVQNWFGIVPLVFAYLGLSMVVEDFYNYRGKPKIKNYFLTAHLQRMTGGFIAALTAFLVVNGKYLPSAVPPFVYWLLPTAILVPVIINWSRKHEKK